MNETPTSYRVDRLADQETECRRLQIQGIALRKLEREALLAAGVVAGHDVLELGCGNGAVTGLLAELVGAAGSVVAIDRDQQMIDRLHPVAAHVQPLVGDVYQLPLPPAGIDFAYARFLLQHLSSPVACVREAVRTLRAGGRFCAVDIDDGFLAIDPMTPALSRLLMEARLKQRALGGDRFIGRKLPRLLGQSGLHVEMVKIIPVHSLQLGFDVLYGLLTGFKGAMSGLVQEFQAEGKVLSELAREGRAFASVGVFCVVGRKQE